MKRAEIKEIYKNFEKLSEKEIKICGWARTIRDSKNIAFIELNDGNFKSVQVVLEKEKIENFEEIIKQTVGSAIEIFGKVVLTPNLKQPFEISAEKVKILGKSESDYPLQKKGHTLEYLRSIPSVRVRGNLFNAVFKIRSETSFAIHKYFNENNFVYVHTPIITGSDCEGAGNMFQVTTLNLEKLQKESKIDYKKDFFGKQVNLTVSGQLHEEPLTFAFGKTYTFGPTFRAENSNTSRHAAEFWMMEPEMCFADINDLMDIEEEMVKYIIKHILSTCKDEVVFLNNIIDKGLIERLKNVSESKFERLTYTKAVEILQNSDEKFEFPVEWGIDLQSEHEKYLTEKVYKKPVFLTDYPKGIKAFYMRLNDDNKTVSAVDLLVPGIGELCGGSQREERLDVLIERMKESGLDVEEYKDYVNLRRYGSNKHSGFGLGFERMVMYVTGMTNIRDVQIYPRTVGKLDF